MSGGSIDRWNWKIRVYWSMIPNEVYKSWSSYAFLVSGDESSKRFLWPSLLREKMCMVGHRDIPCYMSELSFYYVTLLWRQLSESSMTI